MKIGSLFTGTGMLDMAVMATFGGQLSWHSENNPAAAKVLAHYYPDVPNLGDITAVDWAKVEPVDILSGGFPCQDVSAAGRRAGIKDGTRSGLWSSMANAIDQLRPKIVVIENVRGLLSAKANRDMESAEPTMGNRGGGPVLRAAGAVLGDLADLGYDARWTTIPASVVGAPHKRERVFIVAYPGGEGLREGRPESAGLIRGSNAALGGDGPVGLLPTPTARDHKGHNQRRDETCLTGALLPTPNASDGSGGGQHPDKRTGHSRQIIDYVLLDETQWGKYGPAIQRWETITRPAPRPTEPNTKGNPRLSPAFSEWMMGWPAGWATQVPGISRADQLRCIGNGVVPQQAIAALRHLLAQEGEN